PVSSVSVEAVNSLRNSRPASANGIALITLATDCGNAPSGMYAAAIKPVAVPTTVFSAELALLLRTNDTMNAHRAVNAAQHSSVSAPIRAIVGASSQSPETRPRYTTLTAMTTVDMISATTIAARRHARTREPGAVEGPATRSPQTRPRYTTLTAMTTVDMISATTIAARRYPRTRDRCRVGETKKSRNRPDSPSSMSALKAPRPVVTVAMRTIPANIHESTKANT